MLLQQMHTPQVFLWRNLFFPLERRKGLRHKIGCGEVYHEPALFAAGRLVPRPDDLVRKLRDADHVLIRLGRQAQHKIQLHAVPPAGEGRGARLQNFLLGHVLVDRVAQALRPGLGRKRQAAFSHLLHLHHELAREIVRAQRRKRQIDLARRAVIQESVCKRFQLRVVRG